MKAELIITYHIIMNELDINYILIYLIMKYLKCEFIYVGVQAIAKMGISKIFITC